MMRSRSLRLLTLALLPLLAGCDDAGITDDFTFTVERVLFTFGPFQGSAIDGEAVELGAQFPENVLDDFPIGFGPEDVTRARLRSGSAKIRFLNAPPGASIGVLDDVSVRLIGGGTSVEVASAEGIQSSTSMANEATLDVIGVDVADVVKAGDFNATLDVSGDAGLPDGTYRVEVFFDLDVTVRTL